MREMEKVSQESRRGQCQAEPAQPWAAIPTVVPVPMGPTMGGGSHWAVRFFLLLRIITAFTPGTASQSVSHSLNHSFTQPLGNLSGFTFTTYIEPSLSLSFLPLPFLLLWAEPPSSLTLPWWLQQSPNWSLLPPSSSYNLFLSTDSHSVCQESDRLLEAFCARILGSIKETMGKTALSPAESEGAQTISQLQLYSLGQKWPPWGRIISIGLFKTLFLFPLPLLCFCTSIMDKICITWAKGYGETSTSIALLFQLT